MRIYAVLSAVLGLASAQAGTVYVNGKIVTLDRRERVVEAMAVEDGKILALGTNEEMRKLGGDVVDLGGKMVAPGFIETHCHSIGASRAELAGGYQELYSIGGIQNWVRAKAKTTPKGEWIEVPRNEITRLKERRHPTPEELDAASTEHPVLFVSVTKSVLNSAGWKALGVANEDSKVAGGEVIWEGGRPVLMKGGSAAVRALIKEKPAPSPEALRAKLKELLSVYNSVGITSIFERATDRTGFELFRDLAAKEELTTRMRATFRFSAKDGKGAEGYVTKLGIKPGEGDDWVRATCLKITVDGGIHWGTTWLSEPHGEKRAAFYRNSDPAYEGEHYYSPEQMREIFGTVNRLGWPMSAHVTGDGGAMAVLGAVAAVAKEQPNIKDRRFNLIHCYFPSPEMAKLAKELNAGVDTQEYLFYRDADFISKIYGVDWAKRFLGLKTWINAGVPVAINSDHMIGFDPDHAMNSFNPALMLYCAVTRKDDQGQVHGPEQRLSRLDALRTVTQWAAWLSFDEDRLGTLEKGKLADFVVLDRDYLTCPEEEIKVMRPVMTVVGGRVVWRQ
jgi:predicted amidohydrolase YtcJ